MVTKQTAAKSVSAKPAPRPRGKTAESAAQALRSGHAAARALKDAASQAGSAAIGAAAGLTDLVAQASENTLAINPLVGLSRRDVTSAAKSLLKAVTKTPGKAATHYGRYLKELGAVVKGKSELAADAKDRRFADPAWKSNPFYSRLMQAYVATQKELNDYIDTSKLDKIEKGRAHFFASLVTDALAPSNFVLGNPAAVRKIVDTGGENLVKGLKNLVHDVRHNNMLPSQVDATPFKVGQNMATSPGQVVYRDEMFELLQYAPATPQVHRRPLVMSPPQVNKFYAIDLSPDKSLVKWTVDSGVQMFVVSWRNPTMEHRHWGLEDYCMALDRAVDAARQITGSPDVNMWGSCSGGMTLAAYLGWLAAKGDRKVVNTTWAVCVLNTEAALEDSTLGLFNTPATIRAAKARSRRKGLVYGDEMASMFAWLRPNDLVWNYWVNNYLLGNKPPAFDILAWNADTTRLPGQFHCDLLDMVEKNPYVNAGTLEIAGTPIDFGKAELGAYVIGGITDHITPWRACYGTARLFGPETTFVLANAGHLQSLLNPPGSPKSFFFAAPASVEDPMQWARLAEGERREGSWWPHWREWIQGKSGELVDAPTKPGSRKYKPLAAAPGTYVLER
ncbi:MAG: alpha/beta fold hydrolase [Ideonella sp.]|nr:alpha/beta fold hydrolase [Ideonella sp.]MCC7459543.1 alpha/beta fold hydrolase [Nitrospira sp.]